MYNPYNFNELIALTRINEDSSIEHFSSIMGIQYFDASNLLGSLKAKGLVDFSNISLTNTSKIVITELGKSFVQNALNESAKDIDILDKEIIDYISKNINDYNSIKTKLNLFDTDLTMHLFKLFRKGYINYKLLNADNAEFTLTSNGFILLKSTDKTIDKATETNNSSSKSNENSSVISYSFNQTGYESDESKIVEDLSSVTISRDNLAIIITIVIIVALIIVTLLFMLK